MRRRDEHVVARLADGHHGLRDGLLGAVGDHHVARGVFETIFAAELLHYRISQLRGTCVVGTAGQHRVSSARGPAGHSSATARCLFLSLSFTRARGVAPGAARGTRLRTCVGRVPRVAVFDGRLASCRDGLRSVKVGLPRGQADDILPLLAQRACEVGERHGLRRPQRRDARAERRELTTGARHRGRTRSGLPPPRCRRVRLPPAATRRATRHASDGHGPPRAGRPRRAPVPPRAPARAALCPSPLTAWARHAAHGTRADRSVPPPPPPPPPPLVPPTSAAGGPPLSS